MSTEALSTVTKTEVVSDTTAATPPPAAKADPPKEPAAPPAAKADAPKAAPVAAKEPVAGSEKKVVKIGADGDLPEDADLLELSSKALASRIARATKKELKDRFGTDDPDEIKGKLDRLAAMEATEEENRRKELSDRERMAEDLRKANEERDSYKRKMEQAEIQRGVQMVTQKCVAIAEKYIDPDYIDSTMERLKAVMNSEWTEADFQQEARALKKMEEFFKEEIEKKPKLGKDFQTTTEVKGVPLNNAATPTRPGNGVNLAGARSGGVKNVKDMTPDEWREYKRVNKIAY